jgi:hypothetical protein
MTPPHGDPPFPASRRGELQARGDRSRARNAYQLEALQPAVCLNYSPQLRSRMQCLASGTGRFKPSSLMPPPAQRFCGFPERSLKGRGAAHATGLPDRRKSHLLWSPWNRISIQPRASRFAARHRCAPAEKESLRRSSSHPGCGHGHPSFKNAGLRCGCAVLRFTEDPPQQTEPPPPKPLLMVACPMPDTRYTGTTDYGIPPGPVVPGVTMHPQHLGCHGHLVMRKGRRAQPGPHPGSRWKPGHRNH